MADDEIIQRESEAHHQTRNDAGHDLGKLDHEECARGGAPQVLCRLGEGLVHLLEARHDRQHDVGDVEGDVGDEHGAKAEQLTGAQEGCHRNEQKHHGYARHDIGVHHGNVGHGHDGLLDVAAPHAMETQSTERADNRRDEGGQDGQHEGVAQGREGFPVVEQLFVPNQGELGKFSQAPRLVEGEDNEHRDGEVEKGEDEDDVAFRQEFQWIAPPSSSENLFMMATEMMMRIIMTRDMAAPTL